MVLRRVIFNREVCIATLLLLITFQISLAKSLSNGLSTTMAISDQDRCANFSIGNREKKEFYSPNYPNHYPNNTKCTLQLAAEHGQLVQLDFRDQFQMEASPSCEYDRLEIRDGPYGYSTLLQTYCGHKFPPQITSSDRYLWLQFVSDESIEYSGFRAVYNFKPLKDVPRPPPENCTYHRTGHSGVITKNDIEDEKFDYAVRWGFPIDCTWTIKTPLGYQKMYINFLEYKLANPNNCDKNYIEVYEQNRVDKDRKATFCGTTAEPQTIQNIAHIRFFADNVTHFFTSTEFEIHYTAFKENTKDEKCDPTTQFDCADQTCVDKSLRCDGQIDCKYQYDEEASICVQASMTAMVLTSEHMIIILVVFFALVITMCASISISCYNKVKERQAREREYIKRRSKEASVEGNVDRAVAANTDRALEASLAAQASKIAAQRTIPTPNETFPDDDDESSDDACYVPEMDLSAFHKNRDGGESLSHGLEGRSVSRGRIQPEIHKQPYPYISQSTDSFQSDIIVAPTVPPVPMHLKDRREATQPPPYRFIMGRAIPVTKNDADQVKTPSTTTPQPRGYGRWPPEGRQATNPIDTGVSPGLGSTKASAVDPGGPRTTFLRGPLEEGAPRSVFSRSPGEFGLPRLGTARVNPDGPRGPLAKGSMKGTPLATFKGPENYGDNNQYYKQNRPSAYRNPTNVPNLQREIAAPHQFRAQAMIESDPSRPDSVDSTQSAPDVIAQR